MSDANSLSPNQDPIVFESAKPIEVEVTIEGIAYRLREADEDTASDYRSKAASQFRFEDGKMAGLRNVGELQAFLISRCLFRAVDGQIPLNSRGEVDKAALVPVQMIGKWRHEVTKYLFDRAKRISGLDEVSQEKVALLSALSRQDSPVQLQALRDWASTLADSDRRAYSPLVELLKPVADERVLGKN